MDSTAVTVVVPTHGRAHLLATALAGVQAQTLPAVRIVVVDDVGDPATAEVVRRSDELGPSPVVLVDNRGGTGASSSRNRGARQAGTPLLAFLDDDDRWRPQFLERATSALAAAEADLVLVGLCRYGLDGVERPIEPPAAVPTAALLDRNISMTGSNALISRVAFHRVGGFDEGLPVFNDWDFFIRAVRAGLSYAVVPEMLAEWRDHDGDRLSAVSERRAAGIEAFIAKHGPDMTPGQRAQLQQQALGLHRRAAAGRVPRALFAMRLARQLGVRRSLRRVVMPAPRPADGTRPVVLFPHSRDVLGGSVVTGGLLAQQLSSRGRWDVTAVTNGAGPVTDYHRRLDLKVVQLDEGRRRKHVPQPANNRIERVIKRLRLIVAAERYLRHHPVDLIHVNDESSALGWGLAARRRRIPLVWHIHQQKPQTVDPLLLRLSSHVVFVADTNRVRFSGRRVASSSTIHNGVDPAVFHPEPRADARSAVRIAFINELVERKRPDWVVRAAAELLRRGRDVEVVLAGADAGGAAERIRQSKDGIDLGDRLSIPGHVDDVAGMLRSVDVLALPSMRDREAFPRIIVEALASGVPVVATAVAGIPEAVEHDGCGLLVDPDDLPGFIDALEDLVIDPERRHRMGEYGRRKAVREFSLVKGVSRHEVTYDRLLRDRR